ncbi:MAG TPA: hypothetical protein VF746_30375 [Longimicrobium sp.]
MRILSCLAAVVALGACARTPAPAPEPPVPPPAPPPPATPAPAPRAAESQPISICVLRDGGLARIDVTYRPETGDTLVNGRPFSEAYPVTAPPYAAGADWFVRHEPVAINGRLLAKYGLARVLYPEEVKRVGEYRGIAVFAETGATGPGYDVVYLMVRPGCEFQPYTNPSTVGEVRGG